MAVYAPGDDPPPAVDPGMWARIRGFVGDLSPFGSAHAAESVTRGSPEPSPVDPRLAGPGVSTAALNVPNYGDLPAGVATMAPDRMNGLPTTFGGGPFGQGGPRPPVMPYAGGQGPIAGIGERSDLAPAQPNTFGGWPSPIADGNVTAGPTWYGDPRIGTDQPGGGQPPAAAPLASAPLPPARPANLGGVIPANARGEVAAPPTQSPWFTTFDRPNQNPGLGGGMLGGALTGPRGAGGPSQMGMLDLSGLFGGGAKQPAAAAAAPRKIKIPASARAEVPPEAPGPVDASIIARQKMRRPKASSSSQGGGY